MSRARDPEEQRADKTLHADSILSSLLEDCLNDATLSSSTSNQRFHAYCSCRRVIVASRPELTFIARTMRRRKMITSCRRGSLDDFCRFTRRKNRAVERTFLYFHIRSCFVLFFNVFNLYLLILKVNFDCYYHSMAHWNCQILKPFARDNFNSSESRYSIFRTVEIIG